MYHYLNHTFVVCAYKRSAYLGDCIDSLLGQTIKTNIIVVTSTPNTYIQNVCNARNVELRVGSHQSGIARDWNYALSCANTPLVTIAHQDDVYKENYAESMLRSISSAEHPLLYFTDYGELRDGLEVLDNRLLKVKRRMLAPLSHGRFSSSVVVRRGILSLGDPICCPSITYVIENLPAPLFLEDYAGSLDWQMLERVSRLQGDFVYDDAVRILHRIHRESETTALIESDLRTTEDYDMFCKFWPSPIARVLSRVYACSENSNDVI